MPDLVAALEANVLPIALAALLLSLVSLVAVIVGRLRRRPGRADAEPSFDVRDDASLDRILSSQLQRLDGLTSDVTGLAARTRALEEHARGAVRRVGLVRFNPFEDTGSNQSFTLALLDDDGNGVLLSSLHSRQQTRLYTKQIVGWRSDAPLSAEEGEALRQAQSG